MGCTANKSHGHSKQKHSVASKKTSTSSDQTPGLMKLEIACMEFESQLKEEKQRLQKVFESSQQAISTIIEKGQHGTAGKIQGSSVRLINSMNQINIYEILLESCSAIEEETQNLSNHIVSDQCKMLICNIIWSANRLRNVQCLQEFKFQLEYLVDLSKHDLHYLIDPALRSLFAKQIEDI